METNTSIEGAVAPPTGITANFVNPDYVSGGIVPISAVFLLLSTVFLVLRLYTRVTILRAFFLEDYVIIAAWLFSAASTAACLELANNGNGRHLWDVPLETFVLYGKWVAASTFLYVPATTLPKIAILVSYLRVFPDDRKVRIRTYVVFLITIGYVIAACSAALFQCHPVAKVWNMMIPGHCHIGPQFLVNGILNVAIDILVLLVPVPVLMEWKVSARIKLLTGGVFAVGSSTCVVSAVRTYFVARLLHTFDTTRAIVIPNSLTVVETNISVICGCLMVMRPFFRRHLPIILGISSEHVEQTSHAIDNEQPSTVLIIPVEYRPKTSAGFGGVNSSAGWIWHQRNRIDSHATVDSSTEDVEKGDGRGWPLTNDRPPTSDSQDNVIEEMGTL